jgi:DNA ligase 1
MTNSERRLFHRLAAACAAGLCLPALARPAPIGLMLAADAPADPDPTGWRVSEKLDGVRAVWDGRSLRFRSGHPIVAPSWFTADLPPCTLDGELWAGRGAFERLSGTVRRQQPDDPGWRQVRYRLFDLPGDPRPFGERADALQALSRRLGLPQVDAIEQLAGVAHTALANHLAAVVAQGGEGLMLHRADARWRPGRSSDLLKLKPVADDDAVVVGHLAGQGRHAGRLGALRLRDAQGRVFDLGTGFSDAEREAPPPRGSVVTFTYRGRTAGGLPRFASFQRVRVLP